MSSFGSGGLPPSPLSLQLLLRATSHHSPRPPRQNEVHYRRGGVRHDRPRQTPPHRCRSSRRCIVRCSCVPDTASSAKRTRPNRSLSPEADQARDKADPDSARWNLLFAPIVFLWMRSDNRGGTDSPNASEDKDSNATSIRNWHMATSTQQARRGSGTCSTPNVNVS